MWRGRVGVGALSPLAAPRAPCLRRGPSPRAAVQGDRDLEVSLDIAFHALKCDEVDFRVEDSKGILYDDMRVHMTKTPVTASASHARRAASHVRSR